LAKLLDCREFPQVQAVPTARQSNGNDCGLFVLWFADSILRAFPEHPQLTTMHSGFLTRSEWLMRFDDSHDDADCASPNSAQDEASEFLQAVFLIIVRL
jgi:hypothetical protein